MMMMHGRHTQSTHHRDASHRRQHHIEGATRHESGRKAHDNCGHEGKKGEGDPHI